MKKVLPKEHKEDIMTFMAEHRRLVSKHTIFPKIPIKIQCEWEDFSHVSNIRTHIDIEDIPEITALNKKIQQHCKQIAVWGKLHYNDTQWLWDNVLDQYGHKLIRVRDIKWIK